MGPFGPLLQMKAPRLDCILPRLTNFLTGTHNRRLRKQASRYVCAEILCKGSNAGSLKSNLQRGALIR